MLRLSPIVAAFGFATTLAAAPASALTLLDDFNDVDRSGWVDVAGQTNHDGTSVGGQDHSRTIMTGVASRSLAADFVTSGSGTQFVGLLLGYVDGSDHLLVKIQNNDGVAGMDTIFVYDADGDPVADPYRYELDDDLATGRLWAELLDDDTLHFGVDDLLGVELYSMTVGLFASFTGDGAGLSFYGASRADAFYSDRLAPSVPAPAAGVLLVSGLAGLGVAARRRHAG